MLNDLGKGALAIFGGIVTISILSVIVGQKSQAPQVIQAASGALAQVIAAAVNPANTNAANPVTNNQSVTSPANPTIGLSNLQSYGNSVAHFLTLNG